MNEVFEYKPVESARREVRLVILGPVSDFGAPIYCDLQHVFLSTDQGPAYEALSYVWGDDTKKMAIFLGGKSFQVTTNLESALHYLRLKDQLRALWVDAVAINQEDVQEREAQVAFMGLIYQSACWDLLWMGHEINKYPHAMYVLRHRFSDDERQADAELSQTVRNKPSVWNQLVAFFEASVGKECGLFKSWLLPRKYV